MAAAITASEIHLSVLVVSLPAFGAGGGGVTFDGGTGPTSDPVSDWIF